MSNAVESQTKVKKKNSASSAAVSKVVRDAILALGPDLDSLFPEWSGYLAERKKPKPLKSLVKSGESLLWCIPVETQPIEAESIALVKQLSAAPGSLNSLNELAERWLEDASTRTPSAAFGLECLAWAHAMPRLSKSLDAKTWSILFAALLDVARSEYGSLSEKNPWDSQLLLGELPITLGYLFPEFDDCVDLQRRGAEFISASINELLDGEGVCEARHLALLRPLLAAWIRCAWMTSDAQKKLRLSKSARKELDWCIRQVLRFSRADGSVIFQDPGTKATKIDEMIASAVNWSDDAEDKALMKVVVRGENIPDSRLPDDPAFHSEWSELALMQPDWDPKGPRFAVTFDNTKVRAELSNAGEIIFSGPWEPVIKLGGREMEITSEWEVNCWFTDFDIDFLEIEADLDDDWTIQRQFMLARQDHFLWTADVLFGDDEHDIEYALDTTLAGGVTYKANDETREGLLKGKRNAAMLCPPALSEWRSEKQRGDLIATDKGFRIESRRKGRALYVPLFIDLHARRMKQPLTWRQLTVAENLEIVGPDTAVGYRVQAGPEQWLCYRSFTEEGNRTILGQNYSEEFVLARFLTDGDAEPLVEIGGEDEDDD